MASEYYKATYITYTTGINATVTGTKYKIKTRLREHCGLVNEVVVYQWDGVSWFVVLDNKAVVPVNNLFTIDELWYIVASDRLSNISKLADLFDGINCPTKLT